MPRAITKLRFKGLPKSEQAALEGGIAAINAVVAYRDKPTASSAREITAAAFARCAELHAPGKGDYLLDSIKATAKSKGWSDAEIEGARAADVQKSYDINFVDAVVQMGDVLAQLITSPRLPPREGPAWARGGPGWAAGGGGFASLAATFNAHVLFEPTGARLNRSGFGEIDVGMKFKTALGLVAWTVIKLSQLRFYGHVVLRCAECREFKIVSVSRRRSFCSTRHRTLFNVHKLRARRAAKASKHK
jgi:hypothetical protein